MKKLLRFLGIGLVFSLFAAFSFSSCEIGLGEAVDTEPPALSIEYPVADSVIRDQFAIGGTWSDDGKISSFQVSLERTDGKGIYGPFDVNYTVPEESKTLSNWNCIISPTDENSPIVDGNYVATVSIEDDAKHVTTQSMFFTIDNTAPLVVLQRPFSKVDELSPDSYGQTFTLEGQAADDNSVSLIEVYIYSDKECTNLLHTVRLPNVPNTINLDVAKFIEGDPSTDYSKIYGSASKDGTKNFYCQIVAYDGAQRYPTDGSNQSAADLNGNSTTSYYIYEDISATVLSKHKITEVYHMLNGTYTLSDGNRSAEKNDVSSLLDSNKVETGSFSLNPANNPTFSISGRESLKLNGSDFSSTDNDVTNGGTIVVEVATGLDAIPLVGETLKVYVLPYDESKKETSSDKIYPSTTVTKSGTSYKFVTTVSTDTTGFNISGKYIVGVEGNDQSGNSIVPNGKAYGFKIASSGKPPKLTITAPTDQTTYCIKDAPFAFEGTIEVEDGVPSVSILIGDNVLITKNFVEADKVGGKFNFSFNQDSEITNTEDSYYQAGKRSIKEIFDTTNTEKYTFYIQAECNGNPSSEQRHIVYDVEKPTAKLNALPENTDTRSVVSTYMFQGTAEDESKGSGVKEVKLTVSNSNNSKSKTVTASGTQNWVYALTYGDSTWSEVFADEGEKFVSVETVDNVGNTNNEFTYSGNTRTETSFIYDKNNPTAAFTKYNSTDLVEGTKSFNISGEFSLTVTASDSYKLKEIVIKQQKNNDEPKEIAKISADANKKTETLEIKNLPRSDSSEEGLTGTALSGDALSGTFTYIIEAEDSVGNKSENVEIKTTIDKEPPVVTITSPGSGAYGNSSVSSDEYYFRGTATDVGLGVQTLYYAFTTEQKADADISWTTKEIFSDNWDILMNTAEGNSADTADTLYEGKKYLYVKAQDKATNMSAIKHIDFMVDKKAPVVTYGVYKVTAENSTGTLCTGSDTSASCTLNDTAATGFIIKGTAADSKISDIKIKINGNDDSTNLTVDTNKTNWSYGPITTLGTTTIELSVYDDSGRAADAGKNITAISGKSTVLNKTVIFDNVKPTVTFTNSDATSNEITKTWITGAEGTTVYFGGTVTENETALAELKVKVDSGSYSTLPNGDTWNYKYTIPATLTENTTANDSSHTLTVYARDTAGNEQETVSYFRYDKARPFVTVNSSGAYVNATTSVTLSGFAYDACDTANNYYREVVSAVLSATKKDGTVVDLNGDTDGNNLVLTLGTTKNATFGNFSQVIGSGSEELNLPDGVYNFKVTATDYMGNTYDTEEIAITIDTVKPEKKESNSYTTWQKNTALSFTGKYSDVTSGVEAVEYKLEPAGENQDPVTGDISVVKAGTDYTYSSTLSGFKEGTNTITLKARDKAGNVSSPLVYNISIDQSAPSLKAAYYTFDDANFSIATGSVYTNALSNMIVYGTVNDPNSGIKDMSFKAGDTTLSTTVKYTTDSVDDLTDGSKYKAATWKEYSEITDKTTITAFRTIVSWNSLGDATVDLKIKATDTAGNGDYQTAFALTKDQVVPTVSYTPFADADSATTGTQINGKITLSGTADDNVKLLAVTGIQYQIVATSTTSPSPDSWNDLEVEFDSNSGYSWKTKEIDTSAAPFADSKTKDVYVYFRAIATDAAGNETSKIIESNTLKEANGPYTEIVSINQDSDRPVIHLSNLDCTGMTSSNSVWHGQSTLYGTVEDDDGAVTEVKVSLDGTSNWSENIYANGVWRYTIDSNSNGSHTVYFSVKDSINSEPFISSTTAALTAPKIQDNKSQKFGYKNSTVKDSIIYSKFDTEPPVFGNIYFTLEKSVAESVKAENAEILVTQNSVPEGWKTIDKIGESYIGGTNHDVYILYASKDANGIKECTETIGDGNKNATGTMIFPASGTSPYTSDDSWCIKVVKIDISSINSGKGNKLTLNIKDNAESTNNKNYSVYIDMEPPAITIRSHNDGDEVYGSLPVSFNGRTQDADNQEVTKLFYGITKNSTAPTTYTEIQDYVSTLSWAVVFDTAVENTPENIENSTTYHANYLNKNVDELYGNGTSSTDTTKEIYLWIYAEDSLGNSGKNQPDKVRLNVLTQPDKPSVTIDYPSNSTTVGGTIRLSGTTNIKSDSVDSVWLQIDPDYDPTKTDDFSAQWNTELSTLNGVQNVGYTIETDSSKLPSGLTAAIKAQGDGQSWNLSINTLSEFAQIGSGDNARNRIVAIRAYAVSKTNKRLSNPALIYFTVDPNRPVFGDVTKGQELTLVSADGNKQMKYIPGVWVSGKWYLEGSVQHGAGIQTLTMTEPEKTGISLVSLGNNQSVDDITLTRRDSDEYNTGHTAYNWTFKIPVSSASGAGKTQFTLNAVDAGNGKNADVDIIINYDNNAPTNFTASIDSGTLNATGNEFKQNNGTFTISGTVKEPGTESGFERVAFYFTRRIGSDTFIIDPMITKDKGSGETPDRYRNNYIKITSDITNQDGLYWRKVTGAKIENTNKLTVSAAPANVRIGSLCKVNNIIYRIKDISGKVFTLDGTFSNQNNLEVYFALAQVIDNPVTESRNKTTGTTKGTDVYESTGEGSEWSNGDGDQMVEGIRVNGENYSWTASINSKNIYDGSVTLCFAYFDAAGNGATATYGGKICNNAPRLASVTVGTDYDGDGEVSATEKKTKFAGDSYLTVSSNKKATQVTDLLIASSDGTETGTSFMTLKDKSTFEAEIIGGNGKLYYSYDVICPAGKNADGTDSARKTISGYVDPSWNGIQDNDDFTATSAGEKYINVNSSHVRTITLEASAFDNYQTKGYIPNSTSEAPTWFNYTFWDSTDGTNVNSGAVSTWTSQSATMKLALEVQVHDIIKPNVVINKFHWTSATDNSLYQNSKANGHIELTDDWKNAAGASDENLDANLKDDDPKVSGKITFTGYAWDNIRLSSLWINFDNFDLGTKVLSGTSPAASPRNGYKKVASYEAKSEQDSTKEWKLPSATMENDGWEFSVSETADGAYLNENGHKVIWTLSIDTSRITNSVGLDKKLSIFAVDAKGASGGNISAATKDETAGDDKFNTPFYQMDVVPYITGVERNSGYNTHRTGMGWYPLIRGEEGNKVVGFNLNGTTSVKIGAVDVDVQSSNATSATFKVLKTTNGTGSYYSIVDGAVQVTNNSIPSLNNLNSTAAEYNSESISTTDTRWTDDRNVRIWESDNDDKFAARYPTYPSMAMGSDGDLFMSYTFYSKSSVNYTKLLTTTTPAIFSAGDQPEETYIMIDGRDDVNVIYQANQHYGGGQSNWTASAYSNGAGSINLYNASAYNNTNYAKGKYWRFEGFWHNQMLQQHKNAKVATSGNNIYHTIWYDKINHAIKYSNVTKNNTTGSNIYSVESNNYAEIGWVVIDGDSDLDDIVSINQRTTNGYNGGENNYPNNTWNNSYLDGSSANAMYSVALGKTKAEKEAIMNTPDNATRKNSAINNNVNYNIYDYTGSGTGTNGYNYDCYEEVQPCSVCGEYAAICVTSDGYPVIVYFDVDHKMLKVARGISTNPKGINTVTTNKRGEITSSNNDNASTWRIQEVPLTSGHLGNDASYVSAVIDGDGYLHIAFQNSKGQLVYTRSANTTSALSLTQGFTFGDNSSVILDDSGTWVDMTLDSNKVPHISYMASTSGYDTLKLAYLTDTNANAWKDSLNWETMYAPMNYKSANVRTSVVARPTNKTGGQTTNNNKTYWKAGIGFSTEDTYRVMKYIGSGTLEY